MKKNILRALVFCLLFSFLLSTATLLLHAEDASSLPSMEEAGATYLYHLERGVPVLKKSETELMGAGSTVKIMSGLLFCEELAARLTERITITEDLLASVPVSPGFSLRIEAGDVFSAEQLLYAAICGSYNDAYYLLAAHTYGSVDALLRKMNWRAQELGAQSTLYRDITGVQSGSQTTATDLSLIAAEAYENELYMKLCDTEAYSLSTQKISRTVYNRNNLISTQGGTVTKYYDKRCYGMSAGSTPEDGNCVVTVAKHADATYIAIALGGKETDTHEFGYVVVKRMVSWVSDTYTYIEVLSSDKDVWRIPVTVSDSVNEIPLRTHESYSAYLPKGTDLQKEITYSIRLDTESLEAPVEKDTFVGYVAIVYQGQTLKTLPLYTADSTERSSFIGALNLMQNLIKNRAVLAAIIFFSVAFTAWIVTEAMIIRRKRHKWDRYFSSKISPPREMRAPSAKNAQKRKPTQKRDYKNQK